MANCMLGLFEYQEDVINAARNMKDSGFSQLSVMSPVPLHEIDHVLGHEKSPVRAYSLSGAIIGCVSGFALAVACALVFILPSGMRPIISVPPFLIIAYEVTILFGIIFTLVGFFIVARLPAWTDAAYRIESNQEGFTLAVAYDSDAMKDQAISILKDAGAIDVTEEEKRI